jgi:peptidoglycan hydrolase-like amidase
MQRRSFAGEMILFLLLVGLGAGCAPKRLVPLEPGATTPVKNDQLAAPALLDLGLAEGQEHFLLSANGPALVLDSQSRKRLHRFGSQGGQLQCRRQGDRVVWSADAARGEHSGIVLQPLDPGHRVSHDDKDYRGDFLVIPAPRTTGLTLVNQVDLESYLYGVVPWEIGRHGPEKKAALSAQAVAARTYTISHLGSRRALGFDLYASVMDQVYKGSRHEDELCNQAVDETRGLVLEHAGNLVDAYYSACCGGTSSRVERVWPRQAEAYLVDHPDSPGSGQKAFCSESKYFHWVESWTGGRLEEILQHTLPEYIEHMTLGERSSWAHPMFSPREGGVDPMKPGKLLDLEIQDYTPSGRIAQLLITTDAGTYHVRGDRVRWVLAPASGKPSILRSARFELEKVRRDGRLTKISAQGRGYGHGIGLCQTGALDMAAKGYTAQEILSHYYPGSELRRLGTR